MSDGQKPPIDTERRVGRLTFSNDLLATFLHLPAGVVITDMQSHHTRPDLTVVTIRSPDLPELEPGAIISTVRVVYERLEIKSRIEVVKPDS